MDYDILFTYIKAVIYEEEYSMDVVSSLQYNLQDFKKGIQDNLLLENQSNKNLNTINLFCICTTKEKMQSIQKSVTMDILDRISYSKNDFENIDNNSDIYHEYINIYTHYLIDNHLSPLIFSFDVGELVILYLFGSSTYLQNPPEEIRHILDIWYEREQPILLGKQIVTKPFYCQSLIGRKCLGIVSSHEDEELYLLLEGNIKVKLEYFSISSYHYLDTNTMKETDLQNILYNPIYTLGYTFEPYIIFSDWFDIYLYTIALLDIDLENSKKLKASYFAFLDFIDKHICEKFYTNKTVFNENFFFDALKIHVHNIKEFIKRKRGNKHF